MIRFTTIGILLILVCEIIGQSEQCRCLYGDTCFPDEEIWKEFNNTVDGYLIKVRPFAEACHDPNYDEQLCNEIINNSRNDSWRIDQPGAVLSDYRLSYNGQSCLPTTDRTTPCYQGSVPVYAVDARTTEHVQKAVKFGKQYNLRLVIKTTGHHGKSTARGSLLIWTHLLKNYKFESNFLPDGCNNDKEPQAALTLGAGLNWMEVNRIANDNNVTLVGGGAATVSSGGGYVQGGGHSILSPKWGLAADNVLQMKVVLANGSVVITNECTCPDLFWALRGGGGGTFGVVTEVTYKAHPVVPMTTVLGFFISNNTDSYWILAEKFLSLQPTFSDQGFAGYHYFIPPIMLFLYACPNDDVSNANTTFMPFFNYAQSLYGLSVNYTVFPLPSYNIWFEQLIAGQPTEENGVPSGDALTGSRLLERSIFEDKSQTLSQIFKDILNNNIPFINVIIGHLVAGGAVSLDYDDAVNPAWRTALVHYVIVVNFTDNSQISEAAEIVETATNLLRDLSPQSGAYLNEADANEPDWQQSFFGSNYPRLLEIKKKYDSDGLFYCSTCVGSEFWSDDGNCKLKCKSKCKCKKTGDYKKIQ